MKLLAALILSIGIALAGYFVEHGITQHTQFNRYVSVKGLAEKTVKSDRAVWQLNVTYSANDLNALYAGIAEAQNAVSAFWLAQGFAVSDITLQPININDNTTYNNTHGAHYTAFSTLILSSSDVDRISAASQNMNTLVQKNILLNASTITYSFTQLNAIKPAMLDDATHNAEAAAQAFAKNSHSHLNGIRTASQGQFTISDDNNSGMSSINKHVRVVTTVDYFLI